MPRLYLDYETYYSADFSLSRMTTREYILDARFEVIGASLAVDDGETRWYDEPELKTYLAGVDWDNIQLVAHNTAFDGAITQWVYGHKPKLWMDTMGMAQAIFGPTQGGAALKKLAHLVARGKDTGALLNMKGKRAADCDKSGADWARYTVYANEDVNTCRDLMKLLEPSFPKKELLLIDTLLRMYFDGVMVLDEKTVNDSLSLVRAETAALLSRIGVSDKKDLRSAAKFSAMLEEQGVTVPMKVSQARTTKGNLVPAFAKTDLEFTKLLEHDNPRVVALVEAKLNASSSIEETRAARFASLARLPGKLLNVPLRYYGAHTGRFSGADNLNLQNLGRKSPLRDAMRAPEGYTLVVVDSSQIEARMLSWLAGCSALVSAFAGGEDVYSSFATKIYRYPVNKTDHPSERFIGKTGILGLGYGVGWPKFQWALLVSPFYDGTAPDDFCQNVVTTYRESYPEIPRLWKEAELALQHMARGHDMSIGPVRFRNRHLLLPNGMPIQYPQLHYREHEEFKERGYQYYSARYKGWKKIYGAALVENFTQGLARIVISDAMLMMRAINPAYFCCLQVHDELVYCVPDALAEQCFVDLTACMNAPPSWAPGLPLASEGDMGKQYGGLK